MLETVEAVVDALGGTAKAASLAGVGMSAVSNWKQRRAIPPEYSLVISEAVAPQRVDPGLFGFKEPAESRQ